MIPKKIVEDVTFVEQKSDTVVSKMYQITMDRIELRAGPAKTFEKLLNSKASAIQNRKIYYTIDKNCQFKIDSTFESWSKITVVKPSQLSNSHIGWIENVHIVEANISKKYEPKAKVEIFNDFDKLRAALEKNEIGTLRKWRFDGYGWIAASDYYSFGGKSIENGMQNNLAYYAEGDNKSFVKELKLILNLNNSMQKNLALKKFDKVVRETFASINLKLPIGLSSNLQSQREFNAESKDFTTELILDKSRIDTWKLVIQSRIE